MKNIFKNHNSSSLIYNFFFIFLTSLSFYFLHLVISNNASALSTPNYVSKNAIYSSVCALANSMSLIASAFSTYSKRSIIFPLCWSFSYYNIFIFSSSLSSYSSGYYYFTYFFYTGSGSVNKLEFSTNFSFIKFYIYAFLGGNVENFYSYFLEKRLFYFFST